MIALGDEWARAATLANRHGHIQGHAHARGGTPRRGDGVRRPIGTGDRLGPIGDPSATNRDERDERVANAATRAERPDGAARRTDATARRREASREAETMRTFDARRFARLGIRGGGGGRLRRREGGWTVAAAAGVAAMWLGLVGETRRGETRGFEGEANATGWYDEKRRDVRIVV